MISSVKNVFAYEASSGKRAPFDIEQILDMLSTGKEYHAWVKLNKKDGTLFDSFESFCEYEQPWGLGIRPYARFRDALVDAKGEAVVRNLIEITPIGKPGPKPKVDPAQVAELRAQGLTQKAIADSLGVNQATVSRATADPDGMRNYDNIIIAHTPKTKQQGTSREYLLRRLKAEAPELLDEIGDGQRFKSVRAAALEAGIVPKVKTFRVAEKTNPQDFALKLHDGLDLDFVVALTAALTELVSGNMED